MVKPTILHGKECSPIKNSHDENMKVVKIRILRWICEHTRRNMREMRIFEIRWGRLR